MIIKDVLKTSYHKDMTYLWSDTKGLEIVAQKGCSEVLLCISVAGWCWDLEAMTSNVHLPKYLITDFSHYINQETYFCISYSRGLGKTWYNIIYCNILFNQTTVVRTWYILFPQRNHDPWSGSKVQSSSQYRALANKSCLSGL